MPHSNIVPPKGQIPEFASPLSEPVTLHIDIETMEEVRAITEEQDLPPDGLIHVQILERRDAERQRRAAATARLFNSPCRSDPSSNGTTVSPTQEPTA